MRNQSSVTRMQPMRCRGVGSTTEGLSSFGLSPGQQRHVSVSRSSVSGFISASSLPL
jgi:hypothetical protein